MSSNKRILSIDGGGIKGTFPAAFLAAIEEDLDRPIGEYFDLISGTSTGGIIALGLGLGLKASEILKLYEERGPEIFGQDMGHFQNFLANRIRFIRWLYRSKYSSEKLRSILAEPTLFGEKKLGEAKHRLFIPAWDSTKKSVCLYKTPHHKRLRTDYKSKFVDVALATSAAPTFFPEHISEQGVGLIDGGIWANNPIAIAVTEGISILGWQADKIDILSLGCLDELYSLPKLRGAGPIALKLASLFMDGQSSGAMGIAKLLTGHEHKREAIFRISHTVTKDEYRMDDASIIKIQQLKALGVSYAREKFPKLQSVFFSTPAEPFDPLYK